MKTNPTNDCKSLFSSEFQSAIITNFVLQNGKEAQICTLVNDPSLTAFFDEALVVINAMVKNFSKVRSWQNVVLDCSEGKLKPFCWSQVHHK
jgi:hypothetical protein